MGHHHHNHGVKKLGWILGLTFLYFIAELIGGWLTGSLALLADAGHMFTDVAALSLALFASWFASRAHHTQKNLWLLPFRSFGCFCQWPVTRWPVLLDCR